jgi:hypothetical protein
VIKTVRGSIAFVGIGRKVPHRCVVVRLALTGFLLHYSHDCPIISAASLSKLTGLTKRKPFDNATRDDPVFPYINDWHINL